MAHGIMVSSCIFRCAQYNPQTLCLESLGKDTHSFGSGAVENLCLEPVDLGALPSRAFMKSKGWYWAPIAVYRRPLCPQAWRQADGSGSVTADKGQEGSDGWSAPLRDRDAEVGRAGEVELEYVFELYVRSTIPPLELKRLGVCAYLHAGIHERAM
jgi:hypothetical protein